MQTHEKATSRRSARSSDKDDVVRENSSISGDLKEIDWHHRTAQLREFAKPGYIALIFPASLDEKMKECANEWVEVTGRAFITADDELMKIEVEDVVSDRALSKPRTREEILNDPDAKRFDADNVVTLSDADDFDVAEFIRETHKRRDGR